MFLLRKKELINTMLFPITKKKKIKDLEINLTQNVNYLCNKNYKTLLREVKNGTQNGNVSLFTDGKINIIKISILYKVACRLNAMF